MGNELERPLAALVELDRVAHGLRLADQPAGVAKQLGDLLACLHDALALELRVGGVGGRGVPARKGLLVEAHRSDPTVGGEQLTEWQPATAPELDVGQVAERADHQDARAPLGVRVLRRKNRHGRAEQRNDRLLAEDRPVALVVGVGDDRNARAEQLGSRRRDD